MSAPDDYVYLNVINAAKGWAKALRHRRRPPPKGHPARVLYLVTLDMMEHEKRAKRERKRPAE